MKRNLKENLSLLSNTYSKETIRETKKSLSLLKKETRISLYEQTLNWIKNLLKNLSKETKTPHKNKVTQKEKLQEWWNTISERMFQELLQMEGSQNFVAKTHKSKYWENFVTWPYGMVYKHIDSKWNLLNKPVPFKNWERVSKERAEKNARAYYNKKHDEQ